MFCFQLCLTTLNIILYSSVMYLQFLHERKCFRDLHYAYYVQEIITLTKRVKVITIT